MWWHKGRILGVIALVLVSVSITGCGFQPLYKKEGAGVPQVHAALAAVHVGIVPNREGQHLRNRLEQMFRRSGAAPEQYRLRVSLSESRSDQAFQKGGFVTLATLRVVASVELQEQGQPIWTASVPAQVSWNLLSQEYASVISERDARMRAMDELASGIFRAVSVYLSSPNRQIAPETS